MSSSIKRWVVFPVAGAIAWLVAGSLLPNGLPFGVVLLGVILGGLSSLTAMGLVLVYRSARVINFAQAEIGGLAAAVSVVMVTGSHLSYFVALPIGLMIALATGAIVDLTVIRRLFRAPRLIVTVATIGLAQVIGAAELFVPRVFGNLSPTTTFTTPFQWKFDVGPVVFNGNHVVAMLVIPAVLIALAVFFGRTDLGIAIRGAADSGDRALLLGIPVRRLSTLTWVLAAGLSGIAAMLTAPILGPQLGLLAGPESLLAPLAAAVIARMERLTVAFWASLLIGVFQQAVFWSYPRSTTVDVALFAVVLGALLLQRAQTRRTDDAGLGGYIAQREVRPIPAAVRNLPELRIARSVLTLGLGGAALAIPLALSDSSRTLLAYIAIYGVIAISLVILTGWSGQISLGQFAFVGIGAATTGSLFVNAHADLFVGLAVAAAAGAAAAVLIGVPAFRLPGTFLAVTTLAFAVPVSTFLLNSSYFPAFTPSSLRRPALLARLDLNSPITFYYFCALVLVGALVVGRNYRQSRPGRAAIAVRDNARGAASFGVSPLRAKLVAFALSGALAGVAGGLYVVGLRGIGFSGYNPENSVQVFTMAVVGGLGTLAGGLIGAFYVEGAQYFLHGAAQLLATGAGILVVVQVFPGGLAELVYRARDVVVRAVARRHGLSAGDYDDPVKAKEDRGADEGVHGARVGSVSESNGERGADAAIAGAALVLTDVDASYGPVQVLFGVELVVRQGEIVGLLGTNGAGKSTALKVASGLLPASAGRVVLEGEDIGALDPVKRVERGLALAPGGRGVFPSLTVAENLRLAGWLFRHDRGFVDATTRRVFELFPALERRFGSPAHLLSGGEQQMLTIAQSLYCRPKVLLVDELSLGLAPSLVSELLRVLRELASDGMTIVIVEQSLNLATSIAERAVFMERGRVRFSGPTAELAARPDLVRSVFLGTADRQKANGKRRRAAEKADAVSRPVFRVEDLSRQFGGIAALDGVSLAAAPGEILGIIGANGAGKTTLFDICSGYLPPTTGRVVFRGRDVTDLAAHERADLGLGRVFQDARLFPSLTVAEALAVGLERHLEVRDPFLSVLRTQAVMRSEAEVAEKVDELIARLGLEAYREAFVSELSTGTRRMVELGCILGHDPSVLLLDEPTSGIAQRESEAFGRLLVDLRDQTGATFLVIEHDVPLVASIADRMVCLHLGQVIAEGSPRTVLENSEVVEAYLGVDQATIARSGRTRTPRRRTSAGVRTTKRSTGRAVVSGTGRARKS